MKATLKYLDINGEWQTIEHDPAGQIDITVPTEATESKVRVSVLTQQSSTSYWIGGREKGR